MKTDKSIKQKHGLWKRTPNDQLLLYDNRPKRHGVKQNMEHSNNDKLVEHFFDRLMKDWDDLFMHKL